MDWFLYDNGPCHERVKQTFKNEINSRLNGDIDTYDKFVEIFVMVLNKHVPLKKEKIRINPPPYMIMTYRRVIMKTEKFMQ